MHPLQHKVYFNTQAAGISFLGPGELLIHTSPLIDALPPEQSVPLINKIMTDFYNIRNHPDRPSSRYINLNDTQQALWRTDMLGPFYHVSPHHTPRQIILPVVSISLAIEENGP